MGDIPGRGIGPTYPSIELQPVRGGKKPLAFEPARSFFKTALSDFGMWKASEKDNRLVAVSSEYSSKELQTFLAKHAKHFRVYDSFQLAKQALAELDRKWKGFRRGGPVDDDFDWEARF